MQICLYRIDYTIDGNYDYTVNILAESGDAAIQKIVNTLQKSITLRSIDTVCVGINLATDKIVEFIAAPLIKNQAAQNKDSDVKEKKKSDKVYKCPYCDLETNSMLGLTSHKRHKHFVEYTREKESQNENS